MTGDGFNVERFALVDRDRSVCLCDVGAQGFSIAVAVTADGRDTLWIVDESELHAEHPRGGNGDQPHEQLGPLPPHWRDRVTWSAPFRCGRPTKTGRPCRLPVAHAGDACAFHRGGKPAVESGTR